VREPGRDSAVGDYEPRRPPRPAILVNGLLIHIVGVGTPSALFARLAQRPAGPA